MRSMPRQHHQYALPSPLSTRYLMTCCRNRHLSTVFSGERGVDRTDPQRGSSPGRPVHPMAKMLVTLTYSAGIQLLRSQIERALQSGADRSGRTVASAAQSLEAGQSGEQVRREQEEQAAIASARSILGQVAVSAGLSMDLGTALRRHLFANGVFRRQYEWRVVAAGLGPWEALREWFTIAGLDKVEQALKSGRGVILANNHFGAARQVVGVVGDLGLAVLALEADNLDEAWGGKGEV